MFLYYFSDSERFVIYMNVTQWTKTCWSSKTKSEQRSSERCTDGIFQNMKTVFAHWELSWVFENISNFLCLLKKSAGTKALNKRYFFYSILIGFLYMCEPNITKFITELIFQWIHKLSSTHDGIIYMWTQGTCSIFFTVSKLRCLVYDWPTKSAFVKTNKQKI